MTGARRATAWDTALTIQRPTSMRRGRQVVAYGHRYSKYNKYINMKTFYIIVLCFWDWVIYRIIYILIHTARDKDSMFCKKVL